MTSSGLPTLPTGEPILHRWFVLTMLVLAPVAVGVSIWAFLSIPDGHVPPAQRWPVGNDVVTIDRGDAELVATTESSAGPSCAESIELLGDQGARAAALRALSATCQLLSSGQFPRSQAGFDTWVGNSGALRMAVFELSGVEGSTRIEDGRMMLELNAKFVFEDATRAAPVIMHQLALIADEGWPGRPVSATSQLAATQIQDAACSRLSFGGVPPRGCRDAEELLALEDPRQAIIDAGFPAG